MGFFGSFFGSDQRKDIENANRQATSSLTQGRDAALGEYRTAEGYMQPYAQQGQQANALYANSIGANGLGAQQQAFSQYAGSDPFRAANQLYAAKADQNRYNARGWSGNASLAAARASQERGATDWNAHLTRLAGMGQQGMQASGSMAGIRTGMGDLQSGFGQQMAGNAVNYGNAMASSRNIGTQNMLGLGGMLLGGFSPTKDGTSAFGNMASGVGRGYNALMGGGYNPNGWQTSVNRV